MKNRTDFRKTVETGVDPRLTLIYFLGYENNAHVNSSIFFLLGRSMVTIFGVSVLI